MDCNFVLLQFTLNRDQSSCKNCFFFVKPPKNNQTCLPQPALNFDERNDRFSIIKLISIEKMSSQFNNVIPKKYVATVDFVFVVRYEVKIDFYVIIIACVSRDQCECVCVHPCTWQPNRRLLVHRDKIY